MRQTVNTSNMESLARTWDLFLIVATYVPASVAVQDDVKSLLAERAANKGDRFAEIAQFTFIRFCARCAIGEPLTPVSGTAIAKVPGDVSSTDITFGTSIHEQLWRQRTTHPDLPAPFLLHSLAEAIIAKGAEQTEGIFRRSGAWARVQEVISAITRGGDLQATLAHAELHDLASVFKQWFMVLPERVVFGRHTEELMNVYESNKDYSGFVEKLPPAHVNTLEFLAGFLRRLSTFESTTKMSVKNLAIIFAPVIVAPGSATDQFAPMRHTVVSQEFMLFVLRDWNIDAN
jgi:hypothetical protein